MRIHLAVVTSIGVALLVASHSLLGAQSSSTSKETTTPSSQRLRSVWDGVYTKDQAKRGLALYQEHCAACHGNALEGHELSTPLTGGTFTANWNGVSVGELFERTRITMPPDRPASLSRQVIADILAYMFSFNQFPAGQKELEREAQTLRQIRMEAVKPPRN